MREGDWAEQQNRRELGRDNKIGPARETGRGRTHAAHVSRNWVGISGPLANPCEAARLVPHLGRFWAKES